MTFGLWALGLGSTVGYRARDSRFFELEIASF